MASSSFLATLILLSLLPAYAQDTYTNSECLAVTSSMNACASRWDSIRQDCTNSNTANTVWPGPCECSYYANDLPCFDEQALCAHQIWTQVPSWFREGVTSCLQKDPTYTIRAQLGDVDNPFLTATNTAAATASATPAGTISGLATATSNGTLATSTLSPNTAVSEPGLSTGARVGLGVGITGAFVLIGGALFAWFLYRRRSANSSQDEESELPPELSSEKEIFDKSDVVYEADFENKRHELMGDVGAELPADRGVETDGNPILEAPGSLLEDVGMKVIVIPPTPKPHNKEMD